IAALAIGLLAPIPSWALDPNDWEPDTTDARSFERVRDRYRPSLEVRDYPAIFRDLERDLRSAPAWRNDESVYRRLEHAFSVLDQRFARYDAPSGDAAVAAAALDSFVAATPMGGYQFPCPGGECFAGPDVVTYDELEKLPDAKAVDFLQRARTVGILIV